MQQITLRFTSLSTLTTFSKMIHGGYVLNTVSLTISGNFSHPHISIAKELYQAKTIS